MSTLGLVGRKLKYMQRLYWGFGMERGFLEASRVKRHCWNQNCELAAFPQLWTKREIGTPVRPPPPPQPSAFSGKVDSVSLALEFVGEEGKSKQSPMSLPVPAIPRVGSACNGLKLNSTLPMLTLETQRQRTKQASLFFQNKWGGLGS